MATGIRRHNLYLRAITIATTGMATGIRRHNLYLRAITILICSLIREGDGYNCPYGQNCRFDPAPPGRVPPCALPGLTYCVFPDPYPEQVIRKLVESGQYDISTLLSDESREDFNTKKKDYPYGYGPNSIPHVDQISLVNDIPSVFPKNYNTKFHMSYNRDIFAQKTPLQPPSPVDPIPYNINVYQQSNYTNFNKFNGFQSSRNYWSPQNPGYATAFDKNIYRQTTSNANVDEYNSSLFNPPPVFNPNYDSTDWVRAAASEVSQYNPNEWWKYVSPSRADVTVERSISFPTRSSTVRRNSTTLARGRQRRNAELVRAAAQRKLSGAEALKIALGLASAETSAERPRRQAGNTEELCRIRTQFVTPRAALNNRGAWKYIVNMPDNMTQLVKAEICASTECSGLCSVPLGYSTRCEQKYVQKRLVALESTGQNLYTDIFWIPSCCQCTIISNNN